MLEAIDSGDYVATVVVPISVLESFDGRAYVLRPEFLKWVKANCKGRINLKPIQRPLIAGSDDAPEGDPGADLIAQFSDENDAILFKMYWY